MASEMGARRRRLRAAFGDRSQTLVEFLVLSGLVIGSLGLFVGPWMPPAAPWGFAMPLVFVAGFFLLEVRRQRAVAQGADAAAIASSYDWAVFLFSLACAVAGAAAFFIAWSARPAPPADPNTWQPPQSAVSVDLRP